jgi:zinc ribbon protein
MALVCARCGTQNPDTNRFCQACGTPLTATSAPPPAVPVGATAASPFTQAPPPAGTYPGPPAGVPPGPPAYSSPYYSPTGAGPQPGIHRTPWVLIISVIVALLVVMGGVGTVLAVTLGSHNSQSAGFQPVSSPSPAVSPSPGHSPAASPTAEPTSGSSVSNDGVTVVIPAGWTVLNKDSETITLESPNGDGSITVGSGPSSPPQTAQQNKDQMDKFFLQKWPDTKPCPGSSVNNGSLDGAPGIFWELCFTLTSGAQSVQVGAPLFVGANSSGSVYYAALLETEASNMDTFINEAKPILDGGIKWNLK